MKRTATAIWNGSGKEGSGNITTQTNTLIKAKYAWGSRFAENAGTNPEELIAAAHAGCFTMKLSFVLGEAGFTPDEIETIATVTMENGVIGSSHLIVKAKIPAISKEVFEKSATNAKENCPVSKALNMNITMEANLI